MNKVQHSENIDVSRVTLTFELKGNNLNFFYHFFFKNSYLLHGCADSSRFVFLRFSLFSNFKFLLESLFLWDVNSYSDFLLSASHGPR